MDVTLSARFRDAFPDGVFGVLVVHGCPNRAQATVLVAAMFTAEMDTLVLTSGHDLDILAGPLVVDVGGEGERYTKINGKEQAIAPGDMVVRDAEGVIASVVHGPDFRTRVRETTQAALFGAWCPVGVMREVAAAYLGTLAARARIAWPASVIEAPRVLASRASSG